MPKLLICLVRTSIALGWLEVKTGQRKLSGYILYGGGHYGDFAWRERSFLSQSIMWSMGH